tara:strand:- start:2079 stop:3434 length:1356 start_codon:yes stop_codon:yes gene_type:complete
MEIIQSIIGFFIAIGILVTFHEFGHFYIARLFNVKVLNFSIGFGKKIYTRKSSPDSTEYSIGLIPLGGYVKMLESRESDEPMDVGLLNQCFDKQSVYKKFLIVAAGPVFNLILAVIFFIFVHFSGIAGMKPFISSIDNHNIIESTLDDKYEIIKVNNIDTKRWQDVRVEILNSVVNSNGLNLTIRSDSNYIQDLDIRYDKSILKMDGDIIENIGLNIKIPEIPAVIGTVEDNSPAFLAGLEVGDQVLLVNDMEITNWNAFTDILRQNPNNILQLEVLRDSNYLDITLVPSMKTINENDIGYAGISPDRNSLNDYRVLVKYPFIESIYKSFALTYDYTILTFKMIYELFTGQANTNNISGPFSIAEFSGKSLSMGAVYFAYLLAILSISLGVLNLLPIPVLDGGHLVYYSIEMLTGHPVSEKIQLIAQQFGLIILFGIMILAFYNDYMRLVG